MTAQASKETQKLNLAARAGRWSADNWKKALFGWLIFAAAAMVLGHVVGHVQMKDWEGASGESARALKMLDGANFKQPAVESVLVQSRRYTASDPIMLSAIGGVVQTLAVQKDVTNIQDPLVRIDGGGQISRDGHSVLIQFTVTGDPEKAKNKIKPIIDAVAGAQTANPQISIREVGAASAAYESDKVWNRDFANAERLTLPITLIILFVAFGALVAAGLPVILAFSAVLGSIGLYALFTHVASGNFQTTSSIVLLIGMAVGVDYSLFYLRREREERAAGQESRAALLRAAATSGQAVLISGITVLIAMAGMLIASNKIFTSIAFGTMFVVLCAMIGSLTVLPAALAKLGDRVDRGRIPFVGRRRKTAGESRFWRYLLDRVLRRPVLSLVVAGGLLVAAASPAMSMHTKLPTYDSDLPNMPIMKTYKAVLKAFPGAPAPADVIVKAPSIYTPWVSDAIQNLEQSAAATRQMFPPMLVIVSPDRTIADVQIPLAGSGDDKKSVAALDTLRHLVLPLTLQHVEGVQYAVTGNTAVTRDFNEQMKSRLPFVFAFVLGLAFLLLLATFRSVVIPLTSIVLNLLSVGAAYGLLVLIFQHSWAEGILGFRSSQSIASWLPLFLFVVLFGLSMDYNVFILSRIRELRDSGLATEEAVSRGIRRTAGTVTSAALIMVAVFAIFGTLQMVSMKQMGVGLALAVLIDATIIRGVLLPAAMKLLGEWNWYMPRWLEWVPSLTPEARTPAPPRHRLAPGL